MSSNLSPLSLRRHAALMELAALLSETGRVLKEDIQHPDNACDEAYTGRDWSDLTRALAGFTVSTLPRFVADLLRIE